MRVRLVGGLVILAAGPGVVHGQGAFPPDSVVNLEVLAPDTPVREVIGVMRGFAQGLGVRCEYCHVGEAGQPLSSFDFVSDEKPTKRVARDMLRMVAAINDRHLAALDPRGDPPLSVTCATCHHGQARPITLDALLLDTYEDEGIDATVARYHALREAYHGTWTYDFSEGTLPAVAQGMVQREAVSDAIVVLELNLTLFSESVGTLVGLGRAHAQLEATERAIEYLERAQALAPRSNQIRRMLEQLRGN